MTRMFAGGARRLTITGMKEPVMLRVNRRTTPAVVAAAVAITAAACGGERSYDNPPEVPIGIVSSTTSSTTAPTHHGVRAEHSADDGGSPDEPSAADGRPDVRPADGAADAADDPHVARADDRRAVHDRPGRHALRDLPQAQRPTAGPAGGERAQRELADRARASSSTFPRADPCRPTQAPPPQPAAPPAATAAPPAHRRAGDQPPAPGHRRLDRRRNRRRRSPRRPTPSSRARRRASCQSPDSRRQTARRSCSHRATCSTTTRRRRGGVTRDAPQSLSFTFDGPTHLTSVGLIGGYVKVDPLDGRRPVPAEPPRAPGPLDVRGRQHGDPGPRRLAAACSRSTSTSRRRAPRWRSSPPIRQAVPTRGTWCRSPRCSSSAAEQPRSCAVLAVARR